MITGLKKRPTYDELVNEIGEDPIKRYPDRRASQIENSNYMSQLASGFQGVIEQHERVMKEKNKQLLLQEMASGSAVSHSELKARFSNKSVISDRSFQSAGFPENVFRPDFLPSNHGSEASESEISTTSAQREFRNLMFGGHEESLQRLTESAATGSLRQMIIDSNFERQVEQQIVEHQYEMQAQNAQRESNQRAMLDMVAQQAITDTPSLQPLMQFPAIEVGASSSSSAPLRLSIQDIETQTQQPALAIQDLERQARRAISSYDEEEMIPEAEFIPERLRPREEEVRHLFKPKRDRTGKPTAANDKIYHDAVADWEKESLKVLKEQILFRPDIELTKTEFGQLTKTRALILIRNHDKKHPPK